MKKYQNKIEAKKQQLDKIRAEYEELLKKQEEEDKKEREQLLKTVTVAFAKYVEKDLNRSVDPEEAQNLIAFLKEHQYK